AAGREARPLRRRDRTDQFLMLSLSSPLPLRERVARTKSEPGEGFFSRSTLKAPLTRFAAFGCSAPSPSRGEGKKRHQLLLSLAIVVAAATTPAHAQTLTCRTGAQSTAVAELMFGRKIGDRIGVSEAAWARFLDREISPRFPDGLTVVDAAGQWRDQAT